MNFNYLFVCPVIIHTVFFFHPDFFSLFFGFLVHFASNSSKLEALASARPPPNMAALKASISPYSESSCLTGFLGDRLGLLRVVVGEDEAVLFFCC